MAETTERIEYRVNADGWSPSGPYLLNVARGTAASAKQNGLRNVRIETRTITATPWVDLDEGEGFCIGCGESGGDHAIDCKGRRTP